jgi:predicted transcriptional regulator
MESSYEVLRSLTSSRLRQDILSSLDRPMRLSELRRAIDSNAPNTSAKAKELQEMGFVHRDNGDYHITDAGRVIYERLSVLSDTIESYYRHQGFWTEVLDKLPKELKSQIHKFKDAEFVRNEREDLDKVKRALIVNVRQAEGKLTVFLPSHSEELLDAVKNRPDIKVVTLHDDPELRYGLISAKDFTILFTEFLDMALITRQAISSCKD